MLAGRCKPDCTVASFQGQRARPWTRDDATDSGGILYWREGRVASNLQLSSASRHRDTNYGRTHMAGKRNASVSKAPKNLSPKQGQVVQAGGTRWGTAFSVTGAR